ncbi:MAG: nucleotidyltransferase domain-containing protein [candidate division Zixibacteria bacterium]|nr:nucleotidyltransferase domain-containing protein [candidate division Zixibacteria bacterium]
MTAGKLLKEKREEILRITQKHGAYNVRVFGPAVRGKATDESDLDLLVDVGESVSPWFPAGLVQELEEALDRRVDIVTEDSLYWLLKRRILREARPL